MIGGISSGFDATSFAASAAMNRTASGSGTSDIGSPMKKPSAADTFMTYMKKSPAERMVENWLKSHGLDEDKLKAMSPSDREAVMKQMQQEIKDELKAQTEQKGQIVDQVA